MTRSVEATAPCALRLGPGLAVALDRRAWCRVEPLAAGIELESKDGPQRASAARLAGLTLDGNIGWVLPLLRAAAVETGLRISIHGRAPDGAGLGVRPALAVALAAALRESAPAPTGESVAQLVLSSVSSLAEVDVWTAVLGGVVNVPAAGVSGRRVHTDPGKLEERLLLLDVGLQTAGASCAQPACDRFGDELLQALAQGAFDEFGDLLGAASAQAPPPPESVAGQVAVQARVLGGRPWMCASGAAGLMGIWIAPDGRRALLDWLRSFAPGARPVACRLDLLGCDVEQV